MKKNKISKKQQLLNRLEQAKLLYPDYADLFEDIRIAVSNDYPRVNSKSIWSVTCNHCGQAREVTICNLYNGKCLDMCQSCHNRLVVTPAHTPESHRKAALTQMQNGTFAARSPESRRKAALTQLQNGSLQSNLAAGRTSESAHKAAIKAWQTRKSNI